jgi:hypothetical protein
MKNFLLIIFLISMKSFCQSPLVKFNEKNRNPNPDEIVDVSILQLLCNPEKYDGKLVMVKGFIKLEFEGTAIYFHEEDCKNHISQNSIWLNISRETYYSLKPECSDKYGSVIGTFNADQKGHFGGFSGEIISINGIFPNDYYAKD